MSNWLDTLSGIRQRTWNTIKSIGPFLISQSDRASEAFQRHLSRVAEVDVLRELLKSEVETRSTIRRKLLERYISAPDEKRMRIERDIEYLDGVTRQLNVVAKSLHYGRNDESKQEAAQKGKQIEDHWIDHFNELARKRNEEWRNELLARALAQEAADPGSVSPRALWLIGNLERPLFDALSGLLDLCIWSYPQGSPFLPHSNVQAFERKVHGSDSQAELTVGHLIFRLGDIGVVAEHLSSSRSYAAGVSFAVRYNEVVYVITSKKKIEIRGIFLTPLGDSIATFYEPQWNSSGRQVTIDWIASLPSEDVDVREARISPSNTNA